MNQIPYWLSLVSALMAALAGIVYGRRLHARGFSIAARIRVRDCPLLPVAMLLFVALHVATATLLQNPQIGWHLPVMMEYHLTAGMSVLKVAFVTFAMAAVTAAGFAERHASRGMLLFATVIAVLIVDGLAHHSARPNLEPIRDHRKDGVILQSTSSTCAAAAGANIATFLGVPVSEARMVALMHTTWAGTSPAQAIYGFRALGLAARKVEVEDLALEHVEAPAILLVNVGAEPDAHAVAYMGRSEAGFEIWDPGGGKVIWDAEMVRTRWHGRAIEVSRQGTAEAPDGVE